MSDQKQKAITKGGTVFLPAALFGNEEQVLYCCGYDGTETIQDSEGRLYCPVEWLKMEFPEHHEWIVEVAKANLGRKIKTEESPSMS